MAIFKWGVLLVALLGGAIALGAGIATAHDGGTEVRITAMRLDDGRVEFALQEREGEGWGERVLPTRRFFPTTSSGRWLNSTPITVGVVEGVAEATATPTVTATATPAPTSAATTALGAGQQCLTTTGCGFGYFDVPGDTILRVGVDIAPGKWNSDYESAGEDSCWVARLSDGVRSHANYVEGGRWGSYSWLLDLLAIEQPSGSLARHPSVIASYYTDYVYGPQQITVNVLPTDYAIIIYSECR